MLKAKIPGGSDTFHANTAKTTYHMGENAVIDAPVIGIDISGIATGRRIEIDGTIHALRAVSVGTGVEPSPRVELFIGKDAELDGTNEGVTSYCSDLVMRNAGEISAPTGVEVHGGINLVNTGEITGLNAINFYDESGVHVLRNAGTITGSFNGTDGRAIYGSSQIEKVINTGTIHGDVELAGGNDIFIFKSGKVDGDVAGGLGSDVYVVRKAGLNIVEKFGEGTDMVFSSVKFELQANVDDLQLTGGKDINAIGNGGDNWLHGNGGRNLLYGWYGNDALNGGKGNDILTGGVGTDAFLFVRNGGKDTITDYEAGFDDLYLSAFKGHKDFADMLANHVDEKANGDLWITYGADTVVLRDTDVAMLDSGDFHFSAK
jgi:Ca2+-binding RTX toxin-like protein